MKRISKRKTRRKQQKQSKNNQRLGYAIRKKLKQKRYRGKKLTLEQKQQRSQQLAEGKKNKQKRKLLIKERKKTAKIKQIENSIIKIFNIETLDLIARATGFIKKTGEITAFSFIYIMSFGFFKWRNSINSSCEWIKQTL